MRKIFFLCALCASVLAANATEGALKGKFTINANGDQIVFSQGNLQATYDGSSWSWSFATNQWDYIGNAAANNAVTGNGTVSSNGTVDVFGWSTNATYYGIHNSGYTADYSGKFVEWGDNAITNGGNTAKQWRTLTGDEWAYLFCGRTDAAKLFSMGTVNGVNGVILLPDNWSGDKYDNAKDGLTWEVGIYSSYYDNLNGTNFTLHTYTAQQWNTMHDNGAVFLPAAGYRFGAEMKIVGETGAYWSSTLVDADNAYGFYFGMYTLNPKSNESRNGGKSVRLVQAAPKVPQTKEMTPTIAHMNWDETNKQWGITAYEYAGEDPKFVFVFAVDGAKTAMPNVMSLTNSTEDTYIFSDMADFAGVIKDATISITYESTGYQYDAVGGVYYVNAKISGEMSDADGNKVIVKEPANFIKVLVPSDIATALESVQNSEVRIQKVIRDGQLFILRDGKMYNVQGAEVQ